MNPLDEIPMEALIAEGGMPVSAGQAAVVGLKTKSEAVRFCHDGTIDGGNHPRQVVILTPVSDDLFDVNLGTMFFVEGFLSNITMNGADWTPPRAGPLGPTVIHILTSDEPPDHAKNPVAPLSGQEFVGLKGSKLYFTQGRLAKMTKAEPVRVRFTDPIRALPLF